MSAFTIFHLDPDFEFSAPHFYDFTVPEAVAQIAQAESWFEISASHDASPLSVQSGGAVTTPERANNESLGKEMGSSQQDAHQELVEIAMESRGKACSSRDCERSFCTPIEAYKSGKCSSYSQHRAITSPSCLSVKRDHTQMSKRTPFTDKAALKSGKNHSLRGAQIQDIQAKKKQKLEGGRLKQITSYDEKCKRITSANFTVPKTFNFLTEKRFNSARKPSSSFLSMAEKVQRFETNPRNVVHDDTFQRDESGLLPKNWLKPKLTTPKEPEFETAQRSRPLRVKSTAEMEADMIAKMPKFKALPLNKKILEAPSLPFLAKTTPSVPEFQEFHLRTSERAFQHSGSVSVASAPSSNSGMISDCQTRRKSTAVVFPNEIGEPCLHTASRIRPQKAKSSEEREIEELSKIPKFKARPLDKKIFWSRGDLGIFRNTKREVTTPMEFHFATSDRINSQPQTQLPLDLFSKLSLTGHDENQPPKLTKPEPFHLITKERGQIKEERMLSELKDNEFREQEQRIPKANPLPFTTDYPEVPAKPDAKESTIPQPFHLQSVRRHELEIMRAAEEKRHMEQEEIEHRKFHAHPISCNGAVFVPERSRKPLTEVQEFALQVHTRAMERAEFDKKVVQKQNSYKRFREEYEAAKKAEEERMMKLMRRTMVPQALPLPVYEKPFMPKRCSKKLTLPQSPKLSGPRRRERRSSLTFRRRSSSFSIQKRLQIR